MKPELSVNYINLNHVNYLKCEGETNTLTFILDYSVKVNERLVTDVIMQTYNDKESFDEKLKDILSVAKAYNYYNLSCDAGDYFINRDKISTIKSIKQGRVSRLFISFSNCVEFDGNIIPDFITIDFNSESKLKKVLKSLTEIKSN